MNSGNGYVIAAYAVIWFLLMLYVVVTAARTSRIGRQVELLTRLVEERSEEER